jgi:hypothetical protein
VTPTRRTTPSATRTPLPPGARSPTELKYRLIDQFGNIFYCDPDLYPIAHEVSPEELDRHFAEIQNDTEVFQTVLRHTGLVGVTTFSLGQKQIVYAEYKRLRAIILQPLGAQYQFSLRTSEDKNRGFAVEGFISASGAITLTNRQPSFNTCPICLSAGTRIDTPEGITRVEDVRAGLAVWTVDRGGLRYSAVVVKTVKRQVPPASQLLHLTLDDGRELIASPAHPTTDGRVLGSFWRGDMLDGAQVITADLIPSEATATYDILPSGETGAYWANGILVGSTLKSFPGSK